MPCGHHRRRADAGQQGMLRPRPKHYRATCPARHASFAPPPTHQNGPAFMATSQPHQPRYAIELALLAALATLWAGSYTFIQIGVETIPPITLIAARTLIAGSILALIMRMRGIRFPRDRETWRNFTIQACLNSVLPFTLIAWAETSIDAGLAVILNSMTPVFTFLITLFWSRHEATTLRKFIGVVLGLTGTRVIVGNQAFAHVGQELLAQLAVVL